MYRGRFAPSPTGHLHLGSLVAAMASYCDARHHHGQWLLRIEDVDQSRSHEGVADHIIATLARYGFFWDEPIVYQSQRTARYDAALARLMAAHHVYRCVCSRQKLQGLPKGVTGEPIYSQDCRHLSDESLRNARHFAWRVKVDTPAQTHPLISFEDRIAGRFSQDLVKDHGDFIVKRRDGYYAYHLSVVVDDAEQNITHIVRGADLLNNTPRHLWLNTLLGYPNASYAHVPVVTNARGEKLSKQTLAPMLPDDPMPSLLKAWQFLGQVDPDRGFDTPAAFWAWAFGAWRGFAQK
ncbi:MAG: tRNA glutamyl-Q(34) synthetase GluQRS [Burkholderiales bacterium]|jgi:glutamyl-Q tRNA(Asp) synthetase|nr:tRNA glutamyl-Q(34) synthetase GluQRS [Burkholderiales bacterium]